MVEYDFIPGSVTDTCGVCFERFDLQRPAGQYATVRNWGTDTFDLVCDECEDALIPAPTKETRVMPDPIAFEWHLYRGEQYANLVHDGVRVTVTATQADRATDPCFPAACRSRTKSLVRVSVIAYADNDLRLAEADALVHARLCRPVAHAEPWSDGCGRPAEVPDARAIADCAADQITDTVHDARLALALLAKQAARIGVTDTAKEN